MKNIFNFQLWRVTVLIFVVFGNIQAQRIGNNWSQYKAMRYDQVTWLKSHNSFVNGQFWGTGTIYGGANQDRDIDEQLKDGVRALEYDIYFRKTIHSGNQSAITLTLKHGGLGQQDITRGGRIQKDKDMRELFGDINTFLNNNPKEIITLDIEEKNTKSASDRSNYVTELERVLDYWFGDKLLSKYEFTTIRPNQPWPTIEQLTNNGTKGRVIVFVQNLDETTMIFGEHLFNTHKFFNKTPYNEDSWTQFKNARRAAERKKFSGNMLYLSAFHTISKYDTGNRTSSKFINDAIGVIALEAWNSFNRKPSFLSLDFYNASQYSGYFYDRYKTTRVVEDFNLRTFDELKDIYGKGYFIANEKTGNSNWVRPSDENIQRVKYKKKANVYIYPLFKEGYGLYHNNDKLIHKIPEDGSHGSSKRYYIKDTRDDNFISCRYVGQRGVENVGIVSQSSTRASGGAPERAIDDNTSGEFSDNSVTHTTIETDPWWMINFDALYDITRIKVYNRTDCCGSRLNGAKIQSKWGEDDWETIATLNSDRVQDFDFSDFWDSVTADKIRILREGSNKVLSLAEVELSGSLGQSYYYPVSDDDVAINGSAYGNGTNPNAAIDGNLFANYTHPSAYLYTGDNPYWQLDLDQIYVPDRRYYSLVINRATARNLELDDSFEDFFEDIVVSIKERENDQWVQIDDKCNNKFGEIRCLPDTFVKSIKIEIPGEDKTLGLAEVEFYGRPLLAEGDVIIRSSKVGSDGLGCISCNDNKYISTPVNTDHPDYSSTYDTFYDYNNDGDPIWLEDGTVTSQDVFELVKHSEDVISLQHKVSQRYLSAVQRPDNPTYFVAELQTGLDDKALWMLEEDSDILGNFKLKNKEYQDFVTPYLSASIEIQWVLHNFINTSSFYFEPYTAETTSSTTTTSTTTTTKSHRAKSLINADHNLDVTDTENQFRVYPNPTSDSFTARIPFKTKGSLWITDMIGRVLYKQQLPANQEKVTVDHLKSKGIRTGLYVVKVGNGIETFEQKLIVE